MSGYDFLKSQVLSCRRKVDSVCDGIISSGRVFQTQGPATVNARSPTVNFWQMAPSDDWCHQSIVSVSWADWQQERVVPDTAAHFRVKLCTSAQRPCNQSAPGCTAVKAGKSFGFYHNFGRVLWFSAISVICVTTMKISILCVISAF